MSPLLSKEDRATAGRAVDLWVGSSPDAKVPPKVRVRVFERAGGKCHISGRLIRAGEPWDLEHIVPLSMGGRHAEDNMAPALREVHRLKTGEEAGPRAKADRIRMKHLGLAKSKRPFPKRANPWS